MKLDRTYSEKFDFNIIMHVINWNSAASKPKDRLTKCQGSVEGDINK